MSEEIFNENKDLIVESQAKVTKYYEVKEIPKENQIINNPLSIEKSGNTAYVSTELSEDEYFKRLENSKISITFDESSDETKTSYRRLTTTVTKFTTAPNSYRVHSSFIWDMMPKTRSYDVLSTTIDPTFTPISGSNYAQQIYYSIHPISGGVEKHSIAYNSSSPTWSKQSLGYGVRMNLKNDEANLKVILLEGYAYYKIERSSSVVPTYISAFGNYSHAKKSISSNFSYGLSFSGPSISWSGISGTSFDSISTHAQMRY